MAKGIILLGAGGHAKVIADIAIKSGYKFFGFLDDNAVEPVLGFPILGKLSEAENYRDQAEFIVAIGSNAARKSIAEGFSLPWATLIHPSAQISMDTVIGEGSVVMANAVINASARIGKHCIINTAAVIEHDNQIAHYVHISPGAHLAGSVTVGDKTWIGMGTNVANNISICEDCLIGAGAAVVKNIEKPGTYIGVPARLIRIKKF